MPYVGDTGCCGLGEMSNLTSLTAKKLEDAEIEGFGDLGYSALYATMIPSQRNAARILKARGYKAVSKFPSAHNAKYKVTLWIKVCTKKEKARLLRKANKEDNYF